MEAPILNISQQGLTPADVEALRKPFPAEQIEFLRGYAYVREQAVNDRLTATDPSWSMVITSTEYRSAMHVVCVGYMVVKGVVRYGVGEQENSQRGSKDYPLDAAKGAATDLLKRLARMFGVGLYLTELPDNVKDENSYRAWQGGNKQSRVIPMNQGTQQPQPEQQHGENKPREILVASGTVFHYTAKDGNQKPAMRLYDKDGEEVGVAWSREPFRVGTLEPDKWPTNGEKFSFGMPHYVEFEKGSNGKLQVAKNAKARPALDNVDF